MPPLDRQGKRAPALRDTWNESALPASPDFQHLLLPEQMVLGHKLGEFVERAQKHLIDVSGVAPRHAMHLHAPTCAGLHNRLRSLRGKVHRGAAAGLGAGGKAGVSKRTLWRSSTGADY